MLSLTRAIPPTRRVQLVATTLAFLGSLLAVTTIVDSLQPSITRATYTIEGKAPLAFTPPIYLPSDGEKIRVDLTVHVPPNSLSTQYDVYADDCVQAVTVDGNKVENKEGQNFPFCDGVPHRLALALATGDHQVVIDVADYGGAGGFDFHVARTDKLSLAWWLTLAVFTALYLLAILEIMPIAASKIASAFAIVGAILIRILYSNTTPFFMRSHEWSKHLEYIQYMHDHLRMPAASAGWEFHQPPLYYAIGAAWWKVVDFFGRPNYAVYLDFRTFALLISIASALCLFWMGRKIFANRTEATLFGLLGALLPGFVFFSSQISNDTLGAFLSLLVVALLLQWWKKPTVKLWYIIVVTFSLSVLTKISALMLVPMLFICFEVKRKHMHQHWKHLFASAGIFLIMVGWLPVVRLALEEDTTRTMKLGNQGMDPANAVIATPVTLVAFNPARVLAAPYVQPVGDNVEKNYFLEYFYKSAFFGEYGFRDDFKTLSFTILLFGMALVLFGLFGIHADVSEPSSFAIPMSILAGSVLAGAALYRTLFPFAPNQDFRFSVIFIVPAAYYMLRGVQAASPTWKRLGYSCMWGILFLEFLFLLRLPLQILAAKQG